MKTNFFTLRPAAFTFLGLALLCIGALAFLAFAAGRGGYGNLLLAAPADLSAPHIDVSRIEQFCEDEFLLTYEIPSAARAAGTGPGKRSPVEYPVTLVATNSAYPRVTGLPLAEGSFFTRRAWEGKLRHAVLNEEAALSIFGSRRVAGNRLRLGAPPGPETWLVTGVIRDADGDGCRIYVPSSVEGGRGGARALMALVDSRRGISEAYAKNALKTLGLQEGAFGFYSLETQARLPGERALAALGLLACAGLLSLAPPLAGKIKALLAVLRGALREKYLRELPAARAGDFLRLAALTLALGAAAGSALVLGLRLLALALPWQDIPALADLGADVFAPKLALLRACDLPSRLLFGAALGLGGMFFIFVKPWRSGKKSRGTGTAVVGYLEQSSSAVEIPADAVSSRTGPGRRRGSAPPDL